MTVDDLAVDYPYVLSSKFLSRCLRDFGDGLMGTQNTAVKIIYSVQNDERRIFV